MIYQFTKGMVIEITENITKKCIFIKKRITNKMGRLLRTLEDAPGIKNYFL